MIRFGFTSVLDPVCGFGLDPGRFLVKPGWFEPSPIAVLFVLGLAWSRPNFSPFCFVCQIGPRLAQARSGHSQCGWAGLDSPAQPNFLFLYLFVLGSF